jgi:hypothetical protein
MGRVANPKPGASSRGSDSLTFRNGADRFDSGSPVRAAGRCTVAAATMQASLV